MLLHQHLHGFIVVIINYNLVIVKRWEQICPALFSFVQGKEGINVSENPIKSSNSSMGNKGLNKSDNLLKVKEAALIIGETDHVLRNWLKDLEPYVPIQKSEAGYKLFNEAAIDVLRLIQKLHRHQGYSMKQIENYLATDGRELPPLAAVPDSVMMDLMEIKAELQQQREFNIQLLLQLDQQQEYQKQLAERMDKNSTNMTVMLREMLEDKRLLMAANQEPSLFKKLQFWRK
jgi:DNA-binding transcriptional MerR regulator